MDITELISILQKKDVNQTDLANILAKVKEEPVKVTHKDDCRNMSPYIAYVHQARIFKSSLLDKPICSKWKKSKHSLSPSAENHKKNTFLDAKQNGIATPRPNFLTSKDKIISFKTPTKVYASKKLEQSLSDQRNVILTSVHKSRDDSSKKCKNPSDIPKYAVINLMPEQKRNNSCDQFIERQRQYEIKKKINLHKIYEDVTQRERKANQPKAPKTAERARRDITPTHRTQMSKSKVNNSPFRKYINQKCIRTLCSTPLPQFALDATDIGFHLDKTDLEMTTKHSNLLEKAQLTIKSLQSCLQNKK